MKSSILHSYCRLLIRHWGHVRQRQLEPIYQNLFEKDHFLGYIQEHTNFCSLNITQTHWKPKRQNYFSHIATWHHLPVSKRNAPTWYWHFYLIFYWLLLLMESIFFKFPKMSLQTSIFKRILVYLGSSTQKLILVYGIYVWDQDALKHMGKKGEVINTQITE